MLPRVYLDKVSRSYWPGLFHCYEVPGLPRTNNELESGFRDTTRRLLRTTGRKGLTQRTLQRQGAWELLPSPATEAHLCLASHPTGGPGSGEATVCRPSAAFRHAAALTSTDQNAICSTAPNVGHVTGNRHRVTLAPLRWNRRTDKVVLVVLFVTMKMRQGDAAY